MLKNISIGSLLLLPLTLMACPGTEPAEGACTVDTNCDDGFICGPAGVCISDTRPPLDVGNEGEGDLGEGEGDPGEGEGDLGEGEGDLGEGEGDLGEGEGDLGEGEGDLGEGEGDLGEGEGDLGEGEGDVGEGEGEVAVDPDGNDRTHPVDVSIPFALDTATGVNKEVDCFRFTAAAGDYLFGTNGAETGTCTPNGLPTGNDDTVLELFNAAGASVATADNLGSASQKCSLISVSLAAGQYTLCVHNFLDEQSFNVRLTGSEQADDNINDTPCVQPRGTLSAFGTINGALETTDVLVAAEQTQGLGGHYTDVYTIDLAALGGGVRLRTDSSSPPPATLQLRLSAQFDPTLSLYDTANDQCAFVRFNDDGGGGTAALIEIDVRSWTGTMQAVVSSFNPELTGTYTLTARPTLCGLLTDSAQTFDRCGSILSLHNNACVDDLLELDESNNQTGDVCCVTADCRDCENNDDIQRVDENGGCF